jgi:ubiquinone/menaquinone biosynthesis C-methylase UbiE
MGTPPFSQQSFPEMYEQELVGPLFQPWAGPLLDAVALAPGERLLDLACGTGIVARVAHQRLGGTGRIVGIDLSPAMLAVARRLAPAIEWRAGPAEALPLSDGEQFDVVVCQQGLQFFPDRPAALREIRRALAPGGRVGCSTWRPDEELPVLRQLRRIAESHTGPISDRRHGFGEAGPLEALLREAGFTAVRSQTARRSIQFPDGASFIRLNAMALVSMSPLANELTDTAREALVAAITRDSRDVLHAHTTARGFVYDIAATIATGRT